MSRPAFRERRVGGRKPKGKRIGIAYDGQRTEDGYFRGWQQVLAQGKMQVFPNYVKSGGNPRTAVREAGKLRRRDPDLDELWCVSDVDDTSADEILQAVAEAKRSGINLCLSNRCFEIWLVCHFEKTTRYISSESDAVALLQPHSDGYSANNKAIDFGKLFPLTEVAIANAVWLAEQGHDNPSTEVHRLVAKLFSALG
ncbi:RloB family protein [Stakelama marina]|uniref:RloB domain-containing protein n=1 Tax=Stakelama marina TaxID=2826939 RepID=A0A8T4IPK4_9SPHN|nr:RloB family protein [Stakelama marina]MBR0553986.1 RloB domain-containing protein [Stakelama marina]